MIADLQEVAPEAIKAIPENREGSEVLGREGAGHGPYGIGEAQGDQRSPARVFGPVPFRRDESGGSPKDLRKGAMSPRGEGKQVTGLANPVAIADASQVRARFWTSLRGRGDQAAREVDQGLHPIGWQCVGPQTVCDDVPKLPDPLEHLDVLRGEAALMRGHPDQVA